MVTIRAMGQTFVVRNHLPTRPASLKQQQQRSATTIATATGVAMEAGDGGPDDPATPPSSPTCTPASSPSPASETAPLDSLASATCADRSDDYQDFLSKFGILSLPLHPSLDRQSVVQIDSPDDTLVSGSLSPLVDLTDLLLTPDVQPTGGKCRAAKDRLLVLCLPRRLCSRSVWPNTHDPTVSMSVC